MTEPSESIAPVEELRRRRHWLRQRVERNPRDLDLCSGASALSSSWACSWWAS